VKVGKIDYAGLVLLAAGIGCLQTMLERGERLDWFSSGTIVTLAVVSASSLIMFVWHELTTEHPVVDLSILKSRQLAAGVLFGAGLGVCLYATVFIIPVYMQNIIGMGAEETGWVMLPSAIASGVTMGVMGRSKLNPRVSITIGVALFGWVMWQHAHFTTQSGTADFFWPFIFRGMALGLIFVPLTNLALADLPMNKIPNGTGLFNLMRQLGGSVGIALSATLVQRFTVMNRAELATYITPYNTEATARLSAIAQRLVATGTPPIVAQTQALAVINGMVTQQAMMLSFEHMFMLFGGVFVCMLPLLLFMGNKGRMQGGGMAH
jgi:DHA2 family multidrug resistance protein